MISYAIVYEDLNELGTENTRETQRETQKIYAVNHCLASGCMHYKSNFTFFQRENRTEMIKKEQNSNVGSD